MPCTWDTIQYNLTRGHRLQEQHFRNPRRTKKTNIQLPPSVFQTAGATSKGQQHACERSWRDSSWKWTLSVPPAESRLSKSADTPSTLAQIPCIIQCCSSHMDVAAAQQRASGHRLVLWNHMPGLVILPQENIKWKSKAPMTHIYTEYIVWASVADRRGISLSDHLPNLSHQRAKHESLAWIADNKWVFYSEAQ